MYKRKGGLRVVDMEAFKNEPGRYEIRTLDPDAPLCPYGNQRIHIGYDKNENSYVRVTKSVLKIILNKTT
ncbi:hypothetical protein CHU92_12175 [Flavobacterium cyanobacteriorum]|uniref:Uncharacterized protein n=1 Tax=Flavobacterium cyanobacteriorum TaxID=2022802 RepID=A0A255YXX4_9FLAO|nr:hypothetical protein [Flavobacterium cyanobacteriorum]OYQ34086.1 hypothetical protein CHU92_12175 [Flavobacterium cyanobacteriorum]